MKEAGKIMKYFIVDAETDGLYGRYLSVAAQVYNREWKVIDEFYGTVRVQPEQISSDWVRENVYPYLYQNDITYETEQELLEAFWQFWMKYQKKDDTYCIADVMYPVESRLFMECVKLNREEREFQAPFPFYDLESVLWTKGVKKLENREKLLEEQGCQGFQRHYALDDVKITAKLLQFYLEN